MSDPSIPKFGGTYGTIATATANLMRGGLDAQTKTDTMDKAWAFKNTGLDLVGAMSSLFSCTKGLSKMMPFVGKGVTAYDGIAAYKNLQAEKAKPMPDPEKIKGFQKEMFINGLDFVSPMIPMGTTASVIVDGGKFLANNPQYFVMSQSTYNDVLDHLQRPY